MKACLPVIALEAFDPSDSYTDTEIISAATSSAVSLNLYNTLSRKVEVFHPVEQGKVSFYVCGPTVYDDAHLGHARCYMTWDLLYRLLREFYGEANVTYARNVTDVDDKILNKAAAEGLSDFRELAQRYELRFNEDMQALNLLKPDLTPHATQHIGAMHELIVALLKKGKAYIAADSTVYFDVQSQSDYGKLSGRKLEEQQAGARVAVDEQKKHSADFALWKPDATSDLAPLLYEGQSIAGRPGWHIECSAMIDKEFGGQTIDIHCGGQDLVFPHHENEIAQSEGCHGAGSFVNFWMHNGFVNVNGEKMSKSLGNFSTIRELLKRYSVNAVRYFVFSHHYRMPVDFSDEALQAAETWAGKLSEALRRAKTSGLLGEAVAVSTGLSTLLANDLDTPACLSELNKQMKALNSAIDQSQAEKATLLFSKLQANLTLLGFSQSLATTQENEINVSVEGYSITNESIPLLLEERKQAKLSKDWAKADKLRQVLEQAGLELKDNRDGSTSWTLKAVSLA